MENDSGKAREIDELFRAVPVGSGIARSTPMRICAFHTGIHSKTFTPYIGGGPNWFVRIINTVNKQK